jgi:phosphoribosylformylglycinamidine (FGAM) synthase-like enzyme
VVRVKGTQKGLAVKTDCNGRYVYLNPRRGGQIAVAEAARNVVCAGGQPLAITNCLNFGNPYKPEVYWTFREAVGGMGDACRVFGTPVTGGNVSFYNESPEGAVFPTPTIGMLGLVEDVEAHHTVSGFQGEGDDVYLLAPAAWAFRDDLGGSEYLAFVHGTTAGDAPHLDLAEEKAVQEAMLRLIRTGLAHSAHDVSDGGLAVSLAEAALFGGLGADITLPAPAGLRLDGVLFGEAQSRIVFTTAAGVEPAVRAALTGSAVQALRIGTVTRGGLRIDAGGRRVVDLARAAMAAPYEQTIPARMSMAEAGA